MDQPCPFRNLPDERIVAESELSVVIRDGFPASPGHTLIVPKRHVASLFALTWEEQIDVLEMVHKAKATLDAEHSPAGYNIGVKDAAAAGQTVMHVHLHLIPRYEGDHFIP